MNREDVWMVQSRSGSRFSLKPAQAGVVRRKICRQDLQSDEAVESCVLGEIDFTHSTHTEPLQNLVGTNLVSNLLIEVAAEQYARIQGYRWLLNKISRLLERVDQ